MNFGDQYRGGWEGRLLLILSFSLSLCHSLPLLIPWVRTSSQVTYIVYASLSLPYLHHVYVCIHVCEHASMCVCLCVYSPNNNIQVKSYTHTPNLLLSSLLLKSWIFLALITSTLNLFHVYILLYGKLYFFLSLLHVVLFSFSSCLVVLSSYTNWSSLSIFSRPFDALYTAVVSPFSSFLKSFFIR